MLIPVDRLQRGKDPLSQAVLTFFDPKPVDEKKLESFLDAGFNRVQYEIDRFHDVFPKPLDNSKSLKRETVETPPPADSRTAKSSPGRATTTARS